MATVKVYNFEGKEAGSVSLIDDVFGKPENTDLVHQAAVIQLSNRRGGLAHTKDRSEVSGGGKKPFRQKGTGRARAGSTRSPLWIGGGITFGPRNQKNFKKRLPKKMNRAAIFSVLSTHLKNKTLVVTESITEPKQPSTKSALKLIEKLPSLKKNTLILTDSVKPNLVKSFRNIPNMKVLTVKNINVIDLLKYQTVILEKPAVKALTEIYFPAKNKTTASKQNKTDKKATK